MASADRAEQTSRRIVVESLRGAGEDAVLTRLERALEELDELRADFDTSEAERALLAAEIVRLRKGVEA